MNLCSPIITEYNLSQAKQSLTLADMSPNKDVFCHRLFVDILPKINYVCMFSECDWLIGVFWRQIVVPRTY